MSRRFAPRWLNRILPATLTSAALATNVMPAHAVVSPLLQDTFVMTTSPNAVYGGWGSVNVNGSGGRGLLSFDLASVMPAGTTVAQVQKASLIVFVEWMDAAGAVEAVRLTQEFNENTVTAATFPAHTGVGTGKVGTLSGSVRPLTIDITDLVKAAITAGSSTLGLALLPATTTPGVAAQFGSKDGKRPAQLDITLAPPSASTFWATATGGRACSDTCSGANPPATALADVSGNVCSRPDGSRDRSTQYRNIVPVGQTSTWACGTWSGSTPGSQGTGQEWQRLAQCHCAR